MAESCSVLAAQETLIGTASRNNFHFVMAIPKKEWLADIAEMEGEAGAFAREIKPHKDEVMLSLRNCAPEDRGKVWLFPHGYYLGVVQDYHALVESALHGNIDIPYEKITNQRFVLVCTHGKRDPCCAKHGSAFLNALIPQLPENITAWEVSHLGGHRFAATLVVQPSGRWYGNLRPEHVPAFVNALQNRQVMLHHYRGHANYPAPLQVAEAWGIAQAQERGITTRVHLLNPQISANQAWVEVVLESERTALTLTGESYTFIGDCSSGTPKERIIWRVTAAERV